MTGKSSTDAQQTDAKPIPTVEMNFQLLLEDMAIKGWEQADLVRAARARGLSLNANRVARFMNDEFRTRRTWKLIAKALGKPLERYVVRSAAA